MSGLPANDLYNKTTFFTLSGASGGVWLVTTVMGSVFFLDTDKYRWIALLVALVISFIGATKVRRMDLQLGTVAFFNGLLIFVTASGIDAVNQGAGRGNGNTDSQPAKAAILPFTDHVSWWPTATLLDSVDHLSNQNVQLSARNEELSSELTMIRAGGNLKHSVVGIFLLPKTPTVASGSVFEMDVVIAPWSTVPKVIFHRDTLSFSEISSGEKMAVLKFPVVSTSAGGEPEIINDKITVLPHTGNPYSMSFRYTVVKPVIRTSAEVVPILYLNCANRIKVDVPALGSDYNPSFSVTGGKVMQSEGQGRIVLVPTMRTFSVKVNNGNQLLGQVDFTARTVPVPRVTVYSGNTPINPNDGVRVNALGTLKCVVEPDEAFKMSVPDDAKYKITEMEIVLGRGTSAVARMNSTRGGLELVYWVNQARPGDRIVIEIKKLVRINFEGKEEIVNLDSGYRIIIPVI